MVLLKSNLTQQLKLMWKQSFSLGVNDSVREMMNILKLHDIPFGSVIICDFQDGSVSIDLVNDTGFYDYLKKFGYTMLFYAEYDQEAKDYLSEFQ